MKKTKTKVDYSKYIWFLPFLMPIFLFVGKFSIDNDFWFTINQGKYILENGFPTTVINTIHQGLTFLYQSSGTGVLFYLIYSILGNYGIMIFTLIMLELIVYFYYKLCMLVSNNNNYRSVMITTVLMLIFLLYTFPRPHLFTVLNLIIILYCLEKYIHEDNKKYLIPIPFIYLLQVNMHGIYYVPLLIFIIPYLLNSFKYKIKFLNNGPVNYNRKPLFITYLISMLVGFINPYTYKIYPYGFSSYGDATMRENIRELAPITFNSFFGKICIITMIVTFIIYIVNTKKKKIPLRYYLLLLGTFVLALDAYKSFYIFMTCSFFPIAYISRVDEGTIVDKKIKIITASVLTVIASIVLITNKVTIPKQDEPASFLVEYNKIEDAKLYTSFEDGSYFEYKGFNCYVDPRAEVYLKSNNGKDDILKEYFDFKNGKIPPAVILNKYDFDYLVIKNEIDQFYAYFNRDGDLGYKKIFDNDKYQIWEKEKHD